MRVLVTGASGFVGTSVCAALGAAGLEPRAASLRGGLPGGPRALPALAGAEAVVHLAAIAHRAAGEEELERANVGLARELARAAAAEGARFVFMSSVKVHGDESAAALDERSPLAPADAYARSKARAEEALRAIPGLDLLILRPPLVYGPGVKANFRALLRAVVRGVPLPFGGIDNRRSLIYSGNLAHAVLQGLVQRRAGTYLVSDGPPVSTPELCRRLALAAGRKARLFPLPRPLVELLPGGTRLTRSLELDDAAWRRDTAWRPPCTLDEGLRATVQAFSRMRAL